MPDPTADIDRRVLSLLGYGAANAQTCKAIGQRLGVSERAVRGACDRLIKEHGVLVGSSTEGHAGVFLIATEAEYQRYRRQLLSRQEELWVRIRAMDRAWAERRTPASLLEMMSEPQSLLESA
jgi:DNA-binding transcriptional regulator PaaX